MDDNLLQELENVGLRSMSIGVESGSKRIIKMLDVGVEGVINSGLPRALKKQTLYAKWGNVTSAGLIGLVIILIILLQVLDIRFIKTDGEAT